MRRDRMRKRSGLVLLLLVALAVVGVGSRWSNAVAGATPTYSIDFHTVSAGGTTTFAGGGGTVVIVAAGPITINAGGSIHADGANGSSAVANSVGGGGGSGGAGSSSGTTTAATAGSTGQTFAKIMVDPSNLFVAAVHL